MTKYYTNERIREDYKAFYTRCYHAELHYGDNRKAYQEAVAYYKARLHADVRFHCEQNNNTTLAFTDGEWYVLKTRTKKIPYWAEKNLCCQIFSTPDGYIIYRWSTLPF